jgi:hypothetical protein
MNYTQTGIGSTSGTLGTTMTIAATAGQAQTMVQSGTSRLQRHNGDMSKAIIDLREVIDRLVGGEPQDAANKTGPAPVPSGDLGALHYEIDAHEKMLSMLSYQINRLRGV